MTLLKQWRLLTKGLFITKYSLQMALTHIQCIDSLYDVMKPYDLYKDMNIKLEFNLT